MTIPVDIHTHHLPPVNGKAIVNCYPQAFVPQDDGWYSVGIHPWFLHQADLQMEFLEKLVNHPQVLAIGEAGLDKLTDAPMSVQVKLFEQQAQLAMQADKPLVIHLVKAAEELIGLKQALKPSNPWIIHGFRGKAALAQAYLRSGFYLSFGEKYQQEALRAVPTERLFIETDESSTPIEELYQRAAYVRGVSGDEFHEMIQQNIRKVFFKE